MDYRQKLREYLSREIQALESLDIGAVNQVMNVLEKARLSGKQIFICGNGGSASTASHFCCDFNKGVSDKQEKKYRFQCLSDNIPTMTAIANDIGYGEVFRFPLRGRITPGDVLIGVSGSGNSENVINAMEYAKEKEAETIAVVGYSGGRLKRIAHYSIHVRVDDMQITEDVHMIIDHLMMYVLSHG